MPLHLIKFVLAHRYLGSALLFYEYALTIQREVHLIWMCQWSIVTFIFVLVRYLAIVQTICQIIPPWDARVSAVCITTKNILNKLIQRYVTQFVDRIAPTLRTVGIYQLHGLCDTQLHIQCCAIHYVCW